jgi:cytochrome c oxidase subunit 2
MGNTRCLRALRSPRALLLGALLGAGYGLAQVPAGADLPRGERVFELCSQCHGPAGNGNPALQVPAIAGLDAAYVEGQLRNFKAGVRGKHPDDYMGMRMRPMALTLEDDADIPAVAAYVASLPPSKPEPTLRDGDAAHGKELYAGCLACHGPDGGGNLALKAPALNHASDWYLAEQLRNFKAGIRGVDPRDTSGVLMRPMSLQLADDRAIADVVAHIATLGPQPH